MFNDWKDRGLTAFLVVCLLLAVGSAYSAPEFSKHLNRYVGAVISYVVNSGAETSVDIVYDGEVPFRLFEVSASVGGVETNVTVSRVWNYVRDYEISEVITNLFGTVITNSYPSGTIVSAQTNVIYDSTSDTLPSTGFFLKGEKLLADFGSTTNVVLRLVGTSQ